VLPERSRALREAPETKLIAERQIGSNSSIPASGIAFLSPVHFQISQIIQHHLLANSLLDYSNSFSQFVARSFELLHFSFIAKLSDQQPPIAAAAPLISPQQAHSRLSFVSAKPTEAIDTFV
jgi:hypothetical protein